MKNLDEVFKWPANKLSNTLGSAITEKLNNSVQNNATQAANSAGNENGGAGSFGVSDIKNDGTINISNSSATADSF